jgi:hypothetical protein
MKYERSPTIMSQLRFTIAIDVERVPTASRWQPHRWQVSGVVADDGAENDGNRSDEATVRQRHHGFMLEVFRDEAEGYFLNVHSPEPSVFVTLRVAEDGASASPHLATLSYNEAARWMDAQEQVERVPMPSEVFAVLAAWVSANYKPPEKKQRIRPKSFESKEGRYKSGM